ncbi:hypothetical protein LINPERPRIM_LOCUS1077 [Linum perenne]
MTGEIADPNLLLSSQPSTKTSSSISSKSRRTHNGRHHPKSTSENLFAVILEGK